MSSDSVDAPLDETLVHSLHRRAQAAWPGVVVDQAIFAQELAARAAAGSPADLHSDDLYLACACAVGDASAVAAFDTAFIVPITDQLARRYGVPGFGDELRQIVRERLLVTSASANAPRISGYTARGPLAGWVRVTATREAVDLRKKMSGGGGDELLPEHGSLSPDPELEFLRRRYGDVVRQAIAAAIQSLAPDEATVLRLFFLERLKMQSIAAFFRTSERTAQRMVAAARNKILEETRRRLQEGVGGSETQIESLIRVVRADLGASVVELLKKP